MKYLMSRTRTYTVEETNNPTKPLIVKRLGEDKEYENAGHMIKSLGGVDKFLSLCKDEAYYQQCLKNLEYFKTDEYKEFEKARKAASQNMKAQISERRIKAYNELLASSGGVIETTPDNISTVLAYLNTQNWGGWILPTMTIGYRCNQYDCDGKTATTMILDTPIDYYGELCDKFVSGAPAGHLRSYRRI